MFFFLVAILLASLVAALLVVTLYRRDKIDIDDTKREIAFYQSQLSEITAGQSRAQLNDQEAEQSKREISRRLIRISKQASSSSPKLKTASRALTWAASALIVVLLIPVALLIHSHIGAPMMVDMPLKERLERAENLRWARPSQAELVNSQIPRQNISIDSEQTRLVNELRQRLSNTSQNIDGWRLLTRSELSIGNVQGAIEAQQRVIEMMDEQVTAEDYGQLAHLLVVEANGYVSPEAEAAVMQSLARDESHPLARHYLALMFGQTGRPDLAVSLWTRLIEELPHDSVLIDHIQLYLPEAMKWAGLAIEIPRSNSPNIDSVTLDDATVASSALMSESERLEFIEGMVAGLRDRLDKDGGTAEEWSQLIRSWMVLGENDLALKAFEEAKIQFADHPESLRLIVELSGIE